MHVYFLILKLKRRHAAKVKTYFDSATIEVVIGQCLLLLRSLFLVATLCASRLPNEVFLFYSYIYLAKFLMRRYVPHQLQNKIDIFAKSK